MDDARALLDQLMGKDRNVNSTNRRQKKFYDRDVDHFWLCGLSPFLLFPNTKSDKLVNDIYYRMFGKEFSEDKLRDDRMLEEWEELSQDVKDKYGYDKVLMDFLEQLVLQCEKQVEKNRERITKEEEALSEQEKLTIAQLTGEAEKLGEDGDVSAAARKMEEIDEFLKTCAARQQKQKMTLCEVTGLLLSVSDQRLHDHYQGKQYRGWKMIKEKLADYKQINDGKGPVAGIPGYRHDGSRASRSRDRDRDFRDRERRRSLERRYRRSPVSPKRRRSSSGSPRKYRSRRRRSTSRRRSVSRKRSKSRSRRSSSSSSSSDASRTKKSNDKRGSSDKESSSTDTKP
eukprot:Platyproteum_vivax@DN2760_c0_g1_i1.p1